MSDARQVCYVMLAHQDPEHVRRFVAAVAPSTVVLHCDDRTPDPTFAAMAGPGTVIAPRHASSWASWAAVAAELDCIRLALTLDGWEHLVVVQGGEYPLRSSTATAEYLSGYRGRSIGAAEALPRAAWGRSGGLDRLRYLHRPVGRHMVRLPVPRPLPRRVALAGGSVNKVLAREHARRVLELHDRRPELARRWRHTWAPDETYLPTLLRTSLRDQGRLEEWVQRSLWFVEWGGGGRKSPAWLTEGHWQAVRAAADAEPPALFARKVATLGSTPLLDRIDSDLRCDRMAS